VVKLLFKVDEEALRDGLECNPVDEKTTQLAVTFFEMPVRLIVGDTDVLRAAHDLSEPWTPLPLLGASAAIARCIEDIRDGDTAEYDPYDGGPPFVFSRKGNHITVRYFSDVTATASHQEFLLAARDFQDQVRVFLSHRVPELLEHEEVGPWLRGEKRLFEDSDSTRSGHWPIVGALHRTFNTIYRMLRGA
jgi:hypothetical protein